MCKLFSALLLLSTIIVYVEGAKDDILGILQQLRAVQKKINPENLKTYNADIAKKVVRIKPNGLEYWTDVEQHYLSWGIALHKDILDSKKHLKNDNSEKVEDTSSINNIVSGVLASKPDFFFDEAYSEVAIEFGPPDGNGMIEYMIMFTISDSSVKNSMPQRIQRFWRDTFPPTNVFNRLNVVSGTLTGWARNTKVTEKLKSSMQGRFSINTLVPAENARKWDDVIAYLVQDEENKKGMLDPENASMGMHFQWNYYTSPGYPKELVKDVHVVMIFDKGTTGAESYFIPILNLVKTARKNKKITNDALLDYTVTPDIVANKKADLVALGNGELSCLNTPVEDQSPTSQFYGMAGTAPFDPEKATDPKYEIKSFEQVLGDLIKKAENPDAPEYAATKAWNDYYSKTLFAEQFKSIGFSSKIVQVPNKEGAYQWSCCVVFY